MRFCTVCERAIQRRAEQGKPRFVCVCGNEEPATPMDACISSQTVAAEEELAMFAPFMEAAPFDPTNARVMRKCVDCGLPYMAMLCIGDAMQIVYKCKCGREERGDEGDSGDAGVGSAGAQPNARGRRASKGAGEPEPDAARAPGVPTGADAAAPARPQVVRPRWG